MQKPQRQELGRRSLDRGLVDGATASRRRGQSSNRRRPFQLSRAKVTPSQNLPLGSKRKCRENRWRIRSCPPSVWAAALRYRHSDASWSLSPDASWVVHSGLRFSASMNEVLADLCRVGPRVVPQTTASEHILRAGPPAGSPIPDDRGPHAFWASAAPRARSPSARSPPSLAGSRRLRRRRAAIGTGRPALDMCTAASRAARGGGPSSRC